MEKKSPLAKIPDEVILNKIVLLRDKKVMVDKDLAELYGVTTKRLNEQVRRNLKRFPDDFMFQITKEEKESLILQFPHLESLKFSATLPYVFTEHGAVMLASVLNSDIAIDVNIQIVRVFTYIRQLLSDNLELRLQIESLRKQMDHQDKNIDYIFRQLDGLLDQPQTPMPIEKIGYKLPDRKENPE